MLQALKLESASAPVPATTGDKGGADPAGGLFAAVMAQATQASSPEVPAPSPAVPALEVSATPTASLDAQPAAPGTPTAQAAAAQADAQGSAPAVPAAVVADLSGALQAVPAEIVPANPKPAGGTSRKVQQEAAETAAAALAGVVMVAFPDQMAAALPEASIPAAEDDAATVPAGATPVQITVSLQESLAVGVMTTGMTPPTVAAPADPAFTVPAPTQGVEDSQPPAASRQGVSMPPAVQAEIAPIPPDPGPSLAESSRTTSATALPAETVRRSVEVQAVIEAVPSSAPAATRSILPDHAAEAVRTSTSPVSPDVLEASIPATPSPSGTMTAVQVRTIALAAVVDQPQTVTVDVPLEGAPLEQPDAAGAPTWTRLPAPEEDAVPMARPASGQADGTTSTAAFLVLESALRVVQTSDRTPVAKAGPGPAEEAGSPQAPPVQQADGTPAASQVVSNPSQPVRPADPAVSTPALPQMAAARVDEALRTIPLPMPTGVKQEAAAPKVQAQEPDPTNPGTSRPDGAAAGPSASGTSAGTVTVAAPVPAPRSLAAQDGLGLAPVAPTGQTAAAVRTPESVPGPQAQVDLQSPAASTLAVDQTVKAGVTPLRAGQTSSKAVAVPASDDAKAAMAPVGAQQQAPATGGDAQTFTKEDFAQGGLSRPDGAAPSKQAAPTAAPDTFGLALSQSIKTSTPQARAESPAPSAASVFSQVDGSVRWILQKKGSSAELQLHPDSLGRVTIQLKVEGQEVHAKLWASEASTLPVLQEHKAFLEASLKEQGLSLGSFTLQTGTQQHHAQTPFQEQAAGAVPGRASSFAVKQEIPSQTAQASSPDLLDPHQIEVYA